MNTLLPRNAFLGANWQYQDVKQASTNITFNHQISNNWSLNVITSYQNYTKDYSLRKEYSGSMTRITDLTGKDL